MKKSIYLLIFCGSVLAFQFQSIKAQKAAIYSYPVEIELTSDQGDMSAMDYFKNYGTKGIKRGVENVYQTVTPFLIATLNKAGKNMLSVDTLAHVKANEYGKPSTTLVKAIATGIADEYLKVTLSDITQPLIEGLTPQDQISRQKKLVKMRCRIQVYDSKKKLLKDVEGIFQSGEKIDNSSELGVDLRKYQGSEYLQELMIYETCTKMAIIKAVGLLGK